MQVNPVGGYVGAFQAEAAPYIKKSEIGQLSASDIKELNELVDGFKSKIFVPEETGRELTSPAPSVASVDIEAALSEKVASIKEKNLEIQKQRLIEGARSGILNYSDLRGSVIPFEEKLDILLKESPRSGETCELRITGVPNKQGHLTGELKLLIKEDAIIDSDRMVLSQINEPLYREALLRHEGQKHYNFEFFDAGRGAVHAVKLRELRREKENIEAVGSHITSFWSDFDEEAFNASFTPEQRALFGVESDAVLTTPEIEQLFEAQQEMSFMFPFKEDNFNEEMQKATIRGRICEDGSIGELKSVNIHTKELGGKELMDFWDGFCAFMGAEHIYLEDDAKIEGESGSYNLRLFRLMALPDKASWYLDGYGYQPYQKREGGVVEDVPDSKSRSIDASAPFKTMKLSRAVDLLGREGIKIGGEDLALLRRYAAEPSFGGEKTLGDLAKHIGERVRGGESVHKELDRVFNALRAFSDYTGGDVELLQLKELAGKVVNERFYRKSYA